MTYGLMGATGTPVVSFENVRKTYGKVRAVDGLTMELRPGETVAFLGPNGAGKSTSLDMLLDLRKPTSGRIAILSNGSPYMLNAAVQSAGIAELCDAVLSVDAVRMYKPRPEVYALVTAHFDITPRDTVFVSSNRWDVMGAAAFGFRPIWINRANMPDEYTDRSPLRTVSNLSTLSSLDF